MPGECLANLLQETQRCGSGSTASYPQLYLHLFLPSILRVPSSQRPPNPSPPRGFFGFLCSRLNRLGPRGLGRPHEAGSAAVRHTLKSFNLLSAGRNAHPFLTSLGSLFLHNFALEMDQIENGALELLSPANVVFEPNVSQDLTGQGLVLILDTQRVVWF